MHNFELSEEQTMILDTVRKLVQDVAGPQALEHDEECRFVRPAFDALAELGLLGVLCPEASGGAGLDHLAFAVAVEEIGRGCGSTGRVFAVQAGQCGPALEGEPAALARLEPILSGEQVAAFVGPEFGITAAPAGEGFALSGRAALVTAAGEAQTLVVAAEVGGDPAVFCVDADRCQREPVHTLGFRATAPAEVRFDGVSVPADALVVGPGAPAARALDRVALAGQIGSAALAVGMALGSIELARRHAGERVAFGKPLARQQAVGHKLVESRRQAEGARHLTWHAARLCGTGADADAREAAMLARLSAVAAAVHAGDEGIQIHGGYGFTVEYHVERCYRDAKTLEVLDRGADWLRDQLAAILVAPS